MSGKIGGIERSKNRFFPESKVQYSIFGTNLAYVQKQRTDRRGRGIIGPVFSFYPAHVEADTVRNKNVFHERDESLSKVRPMKVFHRPKNQNISCMIFACTERRSTRILKKYNIEGSLSYGFFVTACYVTILNCY